MEDLNRKCKILRKIVIFEIHKQPNLEITTSGLMSPAIEIDLNRKLDLAYNSALYLPYLVQKDNLRTTSCPVHPPPRVKCYPKNSENFLLERYTECVSRKKEAHYPASEVM